jgi:hypothetical protein
MDAVASPDTKQGVRCHQSALFEKDHGGREIMPRLELEVCHLTNDVKNP